MECPRPQPGHHLKPSSFKGHNVKWDWLVGFASARQMSPATQNASSKYSSNNFLINFIGFCGQQHSYPKRKQYTYQQCAEYPARKIFEIVLGSKFININNRRGSGNNTTYDQYFKTLHQRLQKAHMTATLIVAVAFSTEIEYHQRNKYRSKLQGC